MSSSPRKSSTSARIQRASAAVSKRLRSVTGMVPVKSSVSLIASRPLPARPPLKSPGLGLAKLFSPAMLTDQATRSDLMAMASPADKILSVAIGGLGAIGFPVARRLALGMPGLRLAAVAARDAARAETRLAAAGIAAPVVPLAALAERADIVVECLPAAQFRAIAEPAIAAGRIFVPLSAGALLQHLDLVERARESGARIVVPTGALLGLDAVRAAAEGEIRSVTMTTRKPPRGLAGAPYLALHGISLERLTAPLK